MPRGGLSSDPEARARQLDGLRRGNERARARLEEIAAAPASPGKEKPQPGSPAGEEDVERIDYSKARQSAKTSAGQSRAKRSSGSRAKSGDSQAKKRSRAKAAAADESQADEPGLPGFVGGLKAPFRRTYG